MYSYGARMLDINQGELPDTLPLPPINLVGTNTGEITSMEEEEPLISSFHFPPGFRFHPSDEELIVHYLLNKVNGRSLPASVIAEIELYSFNPWELPKKALFGEDEWYFFSPRDRKYPNGERPNRTAASGFWKATGTDKPILSSVSRRIGVKKSLVFYTGRPPNGSKTEWIMNEYRLPETRSRSAKLKGSMRLDDWVLCRVRRKGNMSKNAWEVKEAPCKLAAYLPQMKEPPSEHAMAKSDIMTDRLFKEFQVMASILAGQELPPMETISSGAFQARKNRSNNNLVYDTDSGKENTTTSSWFESFSNSSKNKFLEGNKYSNVLESAKMVTEKNRCEDLLPGSMLPIDDSHFYNDQSEGDMFNLYHSGAVINLAELNEYLLS